MNAATGTGLRQVDYVQINKLLPKPFKGVMERAYGMPYGEMIEEAVPTLKDFDAFHNQDHDR